MSTPNVSLFFFGYILPGANPQVWSPRGLNFEGRGAFATFGQLLQQDKSFYGEGSIGLQMIFALKIPHPFRFLKHPHRASTFKVHFNQNKVHLNAFGGPPRMLHFGFPCTAMSYKKMFLPLFVFGRGQCAPNGCKCDGVENGCTNASVFFSR